MWKRMPKYLEHGEKLFLEQSCTFASEKKESSHTLLQVIPFFSIFHNFSIYNKITA